MFALAGCAAPAAAPAESSAPGFAIDADFPDPDLLEVDGTFYAYATNSAAANVQVATSTDLLSWEQLDVDALPELPEWAIRGKTWAPEVTALADGSFALYFTTAQATPSAQCIGVAVSADPLGPFEPVGDPLVCPVEDGGAIDASTFLDDDGTLFLVFKNDGNCCGKDTWLQAAPLSADGLTLLSEPTRLVKQTEAWEGNLVEAPTLVKHGSKYVLFYSANDYGGESYATGYATADSVLGPWTKHGEPLMTTDLSGGVYLGPGGQDVIAGPDGDVIVFHSWDENFIQRGMNVLPLTWVDDEPVVFAG
ncbi:hypothetical protein EYE40_02880 [Glaciihabitans arcticus]|uniref:Glycoside hydrolase n=2 Tax=Glaciihabitans arcticus TaxID=2668039 RepID=A0A4Q9GY02_9MICO|nr:hypothetical protein EYE40_02880 [Glaciihabitans arcticus]